jgi:glycosyltransferase involved in cell wall biosynthesis
MRIVIDGRMIGWTGIGRYTRRLLEHLALVDTRNDYVVLIRKQDEALRSDLGTNFDLRLADIRPYGWSEHVQVPRIIRSIRPDLVHFPHFNVPLTYKGEFVVTVHDTTMLRFPSHCDTSPLVRAGRVPKRIAASWTMASAIRRARHVLVPSRHTAQNLQDTFHTNTDKISVVPEGVDPCCEAPDPVDGLPHGRYLLYVGNTYPHKNLGVLVRAMENVSRHHPDLFLLVAAPDDDCLRLLRSSVRSGPASGRVLFLRNVTDRQLSWLYRRATLFVMPSLSEGFGLTGLEAMAHGTPVLAARASCLPEVYGVGARYFDPTDPHELVASVDELLGDERLRRSLADAGARHALKYSWEAMAAGTLSCYLAGGRRGTRPDTSPEHLPGTKRS